MAAFKPVAVSPVLAPPRLSCVLAFARPPTRAPGFSMRDRIELDRWSRAASGSGITRVRLEAPEPNDLPDIGGFALIYAGCEDWARWGVAPREEGAVELWSMTDGITLGRYGDLAAALAGIAAV